MARQYSPTQFFRRVPNSLLARYFKERHEVLKEIDFVKLKETHVDPIFGAFTALPDGKQAEIEAECQDIHNMACQGGIAALADEADFHQDQGFPDAISKIDGFHGKAMWAFLEHPGYWAGATLFLHSDNIAESSWKKRNDLPHLPPHVDPEDTELLEQAISHYFHSKEGHGRNCKVEVFRRRDKEYFFAYPEDYAQSGVEWVRNSLSTRARHPAFTPPPDERPGSWIRPLATTLGARRPETSGGAIPASPGVGSRNESRRWMWPRGPPGKPSGRTSASKKWGGNFSPHLTAM